MGGKRLPYDICTYRTFDIRCTEKSETMSNTPQTEVERNTKQAAAATQRMTKTSENSPFCVARRAPSFSFLLLFHLVQNHKDLDTTRKTKNQGLRQHPWSLPPWRTPRRHIPTIGGGSRSAKGHAQQLYTKPLSIESAAYRVEHSRG